MDVDIASQKQADTGRREDLDRRARRVGRSFRSPGTVCG